MTNSTISAVRFRLRHMSYSGATPTSGKWRERCSPSAAGARPINRLQDVSAELSFSCAEERLQTGAVSGVAWAEVDSAIRSAQVEGRRVKTLLERIASNCFVGVEQEEAERAWFESGLMMLDDLRKVH